MQPLVSVIMPVYNVEEYLEDAILSVFNQTYQNIEIILINDGSTDASLSIAEKLKEESEFQFLIHSQANGGLSNARNTGLKLAKGDYIYFFDSDDLIEKEMIKTLVNSMEELSLDAIRFNAESFFDQNFNKENYSETLYNSDELEENYIYSTSEFFESQKIIPSSVCIYLFQSDLFKNNNLHFLEGIIHEDELFTPIVLSHASRLMFVNEPFFKRRYRNDSIMTRAKSSRQHAIGYLTVVKELHKYANENSLDKEVNKYFLNTINRLGSMIFGSSKLTFKENMYLMKIGIKPVNSILKKIKSKF
ncbi:glycosyltransferase family 2 protein [Aerococcus urinae]|uniref:glycosyltransferase family 2 protein n=1 Tax=Aerococcus urinae TaxID=1376 RepID=UPI0018A6F268|nr:glycosyltransferase [Aerococcus urinae]